MSAEKKEVIENISASVNMGFRQYMLNNRAEIEERFRRVIQEVKDNDKDCFTIVLWALLDCNVEGNIGNLKLKVLSRALTENATITNLNLEDCEIDLEGVRDLSEALKVNKTLLIVSLAYNKLGEAGVKLISQGLIENTSVTNVNLGGNRITEPGIKAISEVLKGSKVLTDLDLRCIITLTVTGCKYISDALQANGTLLRIDLSSAGINDEGAQYLCRSLERNATLTSIRLGMNPLENAALEAIGRLLTINQTLKSLDLGQSDSKGNVPYAKQIKWSPTAVSALSEGLRNNRGLTKLTLSPYESDGNAMVIEISYALWMHSTLTHIDFTYTEIEKTGFGALLSALNVNATLTDVSSIEYRLNDVDANALCDVLRENKTLTSRIGSSALVPSDIKRIYNKLLDRNRSIKSRLEKSWVSVVTTLSSLNANQNSRIKDSIVDLLPMIQEMAGYNESYEKTPSINARKFIGTLYSQHVQKEMARLKLEQPANSKQKSAARCIIQ